MIINRLFSSTVRLICIKFACFKEYLEQLLLIMLKQRPFQISLKQLHTQYKQIKKLQLHQQYEVLIFRNITNKKKVLCIKRYEADQVQLAQFIKNLDIYAALKTNSYVNALLAYAISRQQSKIGSHKVQIYLLFEFGQVTLDVFIKKSGKNYEKLYSIEFVHYLCQQALKALVSIEEMPNTEVRYLALSHQLICVNNYGQVSQSLKFCYLPFAWLRQGILKSIDLKSEIYSARELRKINRLSKQNEQILARIGRNQIIFESERQTQEYSCNQEIIQKIGFSLLKCAYYLCQDISIGEITFQMYTMNEQFKIDYNWDLIHAFLSQCSKHQDYAGLANVIFFMLKDSSEDKHFSQYLSIISQMSQSSNKKLEELYKKPQNYSFQDDPFSIEDRSKPKKQLKNPKYQSIDEIKLLLSQRQVQQISNQDGTMYRGETVDNKKHGLGIYYFLQGEIFGGQWKNDEMFGDGVYMFANGQRYAGSIKGEVKEGYGKYMYSNGNIYIGGWKNDLKEGYGELLTVESGERYKGNFKQNTKDGKGTIYYPNHQVFQGQFIGGCRHGVGKFYDKNGRLQMKAKWNHDQIEGDAEIYYENSDYYVGQVKNDKKNGKGTYRFFDGTIYQGQFQNDSLSGQCSIFFNNGDTYNGQIIDGKFAGFGKYIFKQQDLQYNGDWKGGLENGKGTYQYKSQLKVHTTQQSRKLMSFNFQRIQI